ncbi:hypothetical protein B0I26_11740 [Anoxybacillus vitaminiphilus]|uniref:Uncharacterized protein n=1 Tax=Paranoxybacillus vitaminiphilus TaxID=581036 RepID=A0A327Y9F5_9BACL|nr:hypothetical protein B0I26_11740 [Anoxybacillus vitaminiphilus]
MIAAAAETAEARKFGKNNAWAISIPSVLVPIEYSIIEEIVIYIF